MTLIHCSECDTQVSDQAEACPSCAHPLKRKIRVVEQREREEPQQIIVQQTNKGCFEGCGQLFIYIILGIIVLGMLSPLFK